MSNKGQGLQQTETPETILGRCARPRLRLVCVDGQVVGNAVVVVSEEDPNWWRGMAVRRNGEIRVSPETKFPRWGEEGMMAITPERKAELIAALEELIGPKRMARPKVVIRDADVVRDADPHVSRADPNYARSDGGVVRVRRNDFVRINMELYEAQQEAKREDRRIRRMLDPCRLGLYGPIDEDE